MRRLATAGERAVWRAMQSGLGLELHLSREVLLAGPVDPSALAEAANRRLAMSLPLFARFDETDGLLWVEVPHQPSSRSTVDVEFSGNEPKRFAFVSAPFDLSGEPGIRARVYVNDESVRLLAVAHHLLADGATLDAFVLDVLASYTGEEPPAPKPITDVAPHQDPEVDLWRDRIIVDQERPVDFGSGHRASVITHEVALPSSVALREAATKSGVTLPHALMSIFAATVHSWADAESITFVTPVDVRTRNDRAAWGMGVNSIAVRSELEAGQTFSSFAKNLRDSFAAAFRERSYALPELADAARLIRRADGSSILTDFEFNFTQMWRAPASLGRQGVQVKIAEQHVAGAQYDISLSAVDRGEQGVTLLWQLRGSDRSSVTAALLSEVFNRLAESWVASSTATVAGTALVARSAADGILGIGRGDDRPIDLRHLAERVALHAQLNPSGVAVLTDKGATTYEELRQKGEAIRARLRAVGVKPGSRVAVHLDRGVELVATMLGVWAEGAVYVPIDRVNPPARIIEMLQLTHPAAMVTTGEDHPEVEDAVAGLGGATVVVSEAMPPCGEEPLRHFDDDRWPVYVMFTSGSTGKPKAVEIHLSGFLNHLDEMIRYVHMDGADVFGQLAPLGFDVHIWQLVAPLAVGGTLRIYSADELRDPMHLAGLARIDGVTVLQAVPSYLEQWCELSAADMGAGAVPSLRTLLVTGEAFPSQLAARLSATFPDAIQINAYGPAECSDDVALFVTTPGDLVHGVVPIGKPIANTRLYILDRWQRLRPNGMRGELAVGGTAVGNGYLEPDHRGAFRQDPWNEGGRLYLTGDVCSMDGDLIRFHGRVDHQVKIGGRRVELEEIENACLALPEVSAAAVALVRGDAVEVLVAFLVSDSSDSERGWRGTLRQRLPNFMVPGVIVATDQLPLSANGKVDRARLDALAVSEYARRRAVATGSHPARVAWEQVLGVAGLTGTDNFFSLGGDSLGALRVIAALRSRGTAVEVAHIYEASDLDSFIALIESVDDGENPVWDVAALPAFVQWHLAAGPERFLSSIRFETDASAAELNTALTQITQRHSVLRMRIEQDDEVWRLRNSLRDVEPARPVQSVASLEQAAVAQLSSETLFSSAFHQAPNGTLAVCLAAHHAVVDLQAWRLILADLDDALAGRATAHIDFGFQRFCLAAQELGSAVRASGTLGAPGDLTTIRLPRTDSLDTETARANALACVIAALASEKPVGTLAVAVEHDLRFSSVAKARGVGCYVDVAVSHFQSHDDLTRTAAEAAEALRRRPTWPPATPPSVNALVNIVPPIGDDVDFERIRRPRLSRSGLLTNYMPAPFGVDVEVADTHVEVTVSWRMGETFQGLAQIELMWDTLSNGPTRASIDGIDLLDLDPASIERIVNEFDGMA